MRISDWSSDVCSSDLVGAGRAGWINDVDRGFRIEADREQLYRVFFNLAHNALEAGAGELRLAARPVRDFLVIDMEANGPGLPEAEIGRPWCRERECQSV